MSMQSIPIQPFRRAMCRLLALQAQLNECVSDEPRPDPKLREATQRRNLVQRSSIVGSLKAYHCCRKWMRSIVANGLAGSYAGPPR